MAHQQRGSPHGSHAATGQGQATSFLHDEDASNSSKSPLDNFRDMGLFNKQEKKIKADGQPQKRRGPKPDAKPAMTRRQELNRQAQRTHRERKELYIKALEQEVLKLKERFGADAQERSKMLEEIKRLKDLLIAHGISIPSDLADGDHFGPAPGSSSGSFSGSYALPSSSDDPSPPNDGRNGGYFGSNSPPRDTQMNGIHRPYQQNHNVDVDQVGINFVLALERPCMDHMQMLCLQSQNSKEEISGHALMATCPPVTHLVNHGEIQYPHQIPSEMPQGDLLKLLDLSARLPLEGEITPVMAWAYIMRDPRFGNLIERDFMNIMTDMLPKVRCYGFGAVVEEFEIKDALEGVLASKMDMLANGA